MATLRAFQYFELTTLSGRRYQFPHPTALVEPVELSIADALPYERTFEVADDATQVIFSVANGDLASFAFALVVADQDDVWLELVTDDGNEVGEESYVVKLRKNVPFVLGSDDGMALHTVAFAAGTADVIETLRVKNESGVTARVDVLAFQAA